MTSPVNLTLSYYGKQRRHFEFFGNMADMRAIFKINVLLFRTSAVILN